MLVKSKYDYKYIENRKIVEKKYGVEVKDRCAGFTDILLYLGSNTTSYFI